MLWKRSQQDTRFCLIYLRPVTRKSHFNQSIYFRRHISLFSVSFHRIKSQRSRRQPLLCKNHQASPKKRGYQAVCWGATPISCPYLGRGPIGAALRRALLLLSFHSMREDYLTLHPMLPYEDGIPFMTKQPLSASDTCILTRPFTPQWQFPFP